MNELLAVGVLLALIFSEATGLSPGGIIVPAYFCLFLHQPMRIVSTIGMALIVWGIVELLSHYTILYGQRRFALCIVTGLVLKMLLSTLYTASLATPLSLSLSIGYLIPGILARDFERQGIWKTLIALGIVVGLLWLLNTAFGGMAL